MNNNGTQIVVNSEKRACKALTTSLKNILGNILLLFIPFFDIKNANTL